MVIFMGFIKIGQHFDRVNSQTSGAVCETLHNARIKLSSETLQSWQSL